ncbi:MAG: deoxyuridine 5'-triphosphate nucleotidohydrolase [Asgard group archaeon]|nr:deoxyuridine 5'-triphosphate nucleotidohydrolase [Asgard group archaeon]
MEKKEVKEKFSALWMGDFSTIISEAIDMEKQTQVNGFDLSIKEIFEFKSAGEIDFDNSKRKLPDYEPVPLVNNDYWLLEPGSYVIRYNEVVTVPLNAVGIIQPRSTLLRMGGTVIGAIWDSGYSGRGQGLLQLANKTKVYKNARVAQIIFLISEHVSEGYQGTYQNEAK